MEVIKTCMACAFCFFCLLLLISSFVPLYYLIYSAIYIRTPPKFYNNDLYEKIKSKGDFNIDSIDIKKYLEDVFLMYLTIFLLGIFCNNCFVLISQIIKGVIVLYIQNRTNDCIKKLESFKNYMFFNTMGNQYLRNIDGTIEYLYHCYNMNIIYLILLVLIICLNGFSNEIEKRKRIKMNEDEKELDLV